ncbi:MAG: GNAT family N-acetyltransferase [Nocardioides sp.]|nr:GNAT family N-acetyltransferase [Nocardioides sp.]
MTVAELLPALGLRVTAGPVQLLGITDDLIPPLCQLAENGIHGEDERPFYAPWSSAPPGILSRNTAQYFWRTRADFLPESWALNLAVLHDGELVGVQGITTENYWITRTGETGSWLGRRFQGQGIGTAMRQVMCAFLFDHLGAQEVTSAAFVDNPASLAVSRKVGYREGRERRMTRGSGEMALNRELVLDPADFVRGEDALSVEGLDAFRASIGLPPGNSSTR